MAEEVNLMLQDVFIVHSLFSRVPRLIYILKGERVYEAGG